MSTKKILCTRPLEGAEEFAGFLERSGACVITVPMIEIHPVSDHSILDSKLHNMDKYDAIIFTSTNGVRYFYSRAAEKGIKPVNPVYAVGEVTKRAVEDLGFHVTLIPANYNSASLAMLLSENGGKDLIYLFPSGNLSMKGIVNGLKNVDEVIVYETRKPMKDQLIKNLENMFKKNEINCIAFFSPSAVSNFAELFPDYRNIKADIAVIGNTTLSRANEIGLCAKIIAKKSTTISLGEEIINYYNGR